MNDFIRQLLNLMTGLDTDFQYDELRFPTVTVCPVDPFNELNQTSIDYDDDNNEYLKLIETLTSETVSGEYERDNGQSTLRQVVFRLAILCEDLLYDCKFLDADIPCCDFFKPVYSERGFCYSFNSWFTGSASGE